MRGELGEELGAIPPTEEEEEEAEEKEEEEEGKKCRCPALETSHKSAVWHLENWAV